MKLSIDAVHYLQMTELLIDVTVVLLDYGRFSYAVYEFHGTDQLHSLQIKINTHMHGHASLCDQFEQEYILYASLVSNSSFRFRLQFKIPSNVLIR